MAEYKSNPVSLRKSAETVYGRLTNLEALEKSIREIPEESIPADKRAMLDGITVDNDTITIPGGPTGSLSLRKAECTEPLFVSYECIGTPVPAILAARIAPTGDNSCEVTVEADIKVPPMLKPMLNGMMNKMVNEVASQLTSLQLN